MKKSHSLKFNNRAGYIFDNDWIAGVEYENKNEDCSEEEKENELYIESENHENEDQYEGLEAEEEIN